MNYGSKGSTINPFEPLTDPEDKSEIETGDEELFDVSPYVPNIGTSLDFPQEMLLATTNEDDITQGLEDVSLIDRAEVKLEETPNSSNEKDFHQAGSD